MQPASIEAGQREVAPGESFWTIAEDEVSGALGRAPEAEEVDGFWVDLVEANEANLVEPGNPDLILPGQVVDIPEAPEGP